MLTCLLISCRRHYWLDNMNVVVVVAVLFVVVYMCVFQCILCVSKNMYVETDVYKIVNRK